jgi:hypothetical protein
MSARNVTYIMPHRHEVAACDDYQRFGTVNFLACGTTTYFVLRVAWSFQSLLRPLLHP